MKATNWKRKKFTHLAALARMNAVMEAGCFVAAHTAQYICAIEFWNETNRRRMLELSQVFDVKLTGEERIQNDKERFDKFPKIICNDFNIYLERQG